MDLEQLAVRAKPLRRKPDRMGPLKLVVIVVPRDDPVAPGGQSGRDREDEQQPLDRARNDRRRGDAGVRAASGRGCVVIAERPQRRRTPRPVGPRTPRGARRNRHRRTAHPRAVPGGQPERGRGDLDPLSELEPSESLGVDPLPVGPQGNNHDRPRRRLAPARVPGWKPDARHSTAIPNGPEKRPAVRLRPNPAASRRTVTG